MSIFDKFKDKATEMLQGAGDKVTEATGIDVSGVTDHLGGAAEGVTDQAQGVTDQAQGHVDNAANHIDPTQR
jgi:hypothetical protein